MATLRVRLARFGGSRGRFGGQLDVEDGEPLYSATLSVGAAATPAAAQPVVPAGAGDGAFAVLVAVDAPVYVDVAPAPDPTAEPRHLVLPGLALRVHAAAGDRIAAVLAGDIVLPAGGGGGGAAGSVTAAGSGGTQAQAVQGIPGGVPLPVALSADGPLGAAWGEPSDPATPDIAADGASFTFAALFKGMVANLLAIRGALAAPLAIVEQPFRPLPGATRSVTAGPSPTAAGALPLAPAGAVPAGSATSYRVRNAAASASPITWILTVDAAGAPVIPMPAGRDGAGAGAGDPTLDPGGVEVVALTPAQQAALAAGALYLAAVTPEGGSGVLSITPGVGG